MCLVNIQESRGLKSRIGLEISNKNLSELLSQLNIPIQDDIPNYELFFFWDSYSSGFYTRDNLDYFGFVSVGNYEGRDGIKELNYCLEFCKKSKIRKRDSLFLIEQSYRYLVGNKENQ